MMTEIGCLLGRANGNMQNNAGGKEFGGEKKGEGYLWRAKKKRRGRSLDVTGGT